jgi:predicted transcriptional regulator
VREFILQFGLKKHTDRVLAFGFFLEKNMGQESFTPADINSLYYDSKMEASNTSQMLIQNIKRGFVMEAKSTGSAKKRYTLTNSGETYLTGLMNSPNS